MRPLAIALGLAIALLPVAAGAGKREDLLQADVDELQRQVYDLKQSLDRQGQDLSRLLDLLDGSTEARRERAQFNANVQALRDDLRALATRFEETTRRLGQLERRVATTCVPAPADPVPGPAASAPPEDASPDPSESAPSSNPRPPDTSPLAANGGAKLFQQAYGDYVRGNFELAVAGFRDHLRSDPAAATAPQAHYWLAQSLLKLRKPEEALLELEQLLSRYPDAENLPDALYRKGETLLQLNRMGQAVLVFNELVSRHPDTPAAAQAAERLKDLAREPR